LTRLERSRNAAVDADRLAYAEAIRGGERDPGTANADKAEKAITAAPCREEALGTATAQASADLADALAEHRGEIERVLAEQLAAARKTYGEAVQALLDSFGELAGALALRPWVEGGLDARYVPGKHVPRLRGLAGPNGEAPSFTQIAGALFELAEEPKVARPAGPMPTPDRAAA
jgi:hypothetical protein